jgi:ABC-type transport system involved in multi-copper enzyme maturation permease subunit
MFATFFLERDPLQWSDLPAMLLTWLEVAGGFAAVLLAIWLLSTLAAKPSGPPGWQLGGLAKRLFNFALLVGAIAYVIGGGLKIIALQRQAEGASAPGYDNPANILLAVAGGCALLAVLLPFFQDLGRLSGRRMWALARLSFKEAIRRRVLWVFCALFLVPLFAGWFLEYKPEDQVRNYVHVISFAMTVLFLVTAALIASFSLPADIKNQTIHTIVTKPVERFEIILGRFIGYTLLMSLVLLVATTLSLGYMVREIDEEAKKETLRARVPVRGDLRFEGAQGFKGDSVGREWEYRRYIAGGPGSPHRAVWSFRDPPGGLASRNKNIRCEFTFDIFRTSKGRPEDEGKGVFATLQFHSWQWNPADGSALERYRKELEQMRTQPNLENELAQKYPDYAKSLDAQVQDREISPAERREFLIKNDLAEKYGYYDIPSKTVYDYHTMFVFVPPGLFKKSLDGADKRPADVTNPGTKVAPVEVRVKCESPSQYLGMAKYDLYLLDSESKFWLNFFKGAVGLWLRMCVVIGLAVTASTYLSGVIAFLATMFIYLLGFFHDFVRELAENKVPGGGPMESLVRLVTKENLITPLESSPGANLAQGSDQGFRFLFRVIQYILPDVDRFDWTDHVAEGFNISAETMVLTLLVLVGYLIPCGLLAYYLMKSREVAA